MKLARKLSLGLFFGVLLVVAASAYQRIRRESSLFDTDMRRDQVLIGRTLAAALEEVWLAEGEARVMDLVRRADAAKADLFIRWVRIGADVPPERRPLVADLAAALPAPFQPVPRVATIQQADGFPQERLLTYVPLPRHDGVLAALEISEATAPKSDYIRATLISVFVSSLAIAAVCGLVAMLLGAWFVGRPVEALIARARAIGKGDFESRLALRPADEIGALASELDATSAQLARARDRLATVTASRIAAVEQLRHAERLTTLGRLSSVIAHEIGTPLGVVSGYSKMIASDRVRGGEAQEAANVMLEQCDRISRLIRRVLDYAHRGEPRKQPTSLSDVLSATVTLLRPLAEKSGITLLLSHSLAGDIAVDGAQIQQAVTNLIINAVQASEPGREIKIRLERTSEAPALAQGREYVCVSVVDEGAGIPEEALGRIWEPFFTTKPSSEGTGLGLSITRDIVEEHGGFVTVESVPGSGSRFCIYLPLGVIDEQSRACADS